MATIRTAIQMVDAMSPVIRGMNNALNIVISSFESMQRASSNSVDTSSIEAARRELAGAEASLNQMESSIKNSSNQQQQFNNTIIEGERAADGLINKIGTMVKAYLGFQAAKNIADTSDQFVQTRARLDLINDGLRTTDELQNMIFQSAQRARASYSDTANVVAKLGTLAKSAFSSNDEMVAFAEQMNKQFKIGGASIQEQTAGMYQLTQAMASGKLQGDEFRSIMENAPLLAQAIATYTGKSMGELRKMSSEGQITAGIIKKALFSTAEDTEARFSKIPRTIGEIWVSIKNEALMAFQPILLKINEVANNPNVNRMVALIVNGFVIIANTGLNVINVLANIVAFFQNNWSIIQPIIIGIVAAFAIYEGIMIASAVATGIASFANSVYAIGAYNACASLAATEMAIMGKVSAQTIEAMVTAEATAAQWGFNAALLACPITWIIVAIIAVIAIIYIAIAVINKVTGSTYSATGFIAGCIVSMGAVIYNVIAYVWNAVAAYAEFFANVFTNPVYSVKKLFASFAYDVLDMCISMTSGFDTFATNMANAIISGINAAIGAWNDFVDLLSSVGISDKLGLGKGSEISYTTSITSDLQNMKGKISDWLGETPSDYWTAQRMEMKSVGAAFDSGYAWGNDVSNMFNMPESSALSDGFNYDDLLKNAKDTADNTGKMKDKMDITEEDLKYLRDIAEQEVLNRFTTAEIKVDMVNHNSINSDMDIDGVIDHFGSSLYEHLQTVAEGATYDNV